MVTVKTILLVEDDQVASTTYQSRLEREGFHVETASDGLTALRTLSKLTIDLVILDLILPKLGGTSVLKHMRTNPHLQNVPVIVLSNAASPELDEDAMLTGPTRRLHKTDCPFSLLMQTIQELFAINSAQTTRAEPATAGETTPASANGEPKPGGDITALCSRSPEQSESLKAVLQKIPEIREHCCAYIRAPGSPANTQHLVELHQSASWVRTNAEDLGWMRITMLARALEALLSEIKAKPSVITPSILQTIAQAVDCLALLLKSAEVDLARPLTRAKVLVVDDDAVCIMANVKSLKRANLDAEGINDPVAALQKLQFAAVDAVLLDINMPGINGFELCEKLRHLPGCKTIPVIFITGYSNFDNRKQSVLSGGQDFITKPIFPLELALKTTLHLLKAQVRHPILHNVTPEPGTAGTQITSLPEVGKPESSVLRVAGSRSAQPEPAIPIRLAVTHPLDMRVATSAAFAPKARAAAGSGTAGFSTMESPVLMPPQTASSVPDEPRMQAKPQNGTATVPPAKPPSGEERPARSNVSETEPAGLPDKQSELQIKLAAEQQAAARLRQDFVALQQKLHENAAALEKARLDLQEQGTKLQAATDAAGQAGKALQQNQARCQELEREAAALQAGRSELQAKLEAEQKRAAEIERDYKALEEMLDESSEASAQAHADLQQASEKLRTLTAEADQTKKQLQETEAHRSQLEQDLAGVVAGRSELESKLAGEQQASGKLRQEFEALQKQQQDGTSVLNQARADLQQQSAERTRLESELQRQQESATASTIQTQAALGEQEARCRQLTQELTGLRQEHRETHARLAAEQETAAKSRQDSAVLQQQLNESSVALEQTRTELQQQKTERARWETEHRNLAAANETLNLELIRLREQVESMKAYPVLDAPTEGRAQAFQLTAPDAGTVLLVGDFTGWQKEPVPMQPGVDGIWSATVTLLPGTHLYMFIVDGKWLEDPACTQRVPNGLGGQNMVRQVV